MIITEEKYGFLILIPFIALIILGIFSTSWQTSELKKIYLTNKTFDTKSIMGWMTMNDLSKATKISLTQLYKISSLSLSIDPNTPLKEISAKYNLENFETQNVRDAIEQYKKIENEKGNNFKCPYGIKHDPAPGLCGYYTDQDKNRNCDYELS